MNDALEKRSKSDEQAFDQRLRRVSDAHAELKATMARSPAGCNSPQVREQMQRVAKEMSAYMFATQCISKVTRR